MSDSTPSSIFDRPNSYPPWAPRIWTGMLPNDYWKLLSENRFRIHPTRYPMTGIISCWTLLNAGLYAVQRFAHGAGIESTEIEQPPIFIIGHWRSGTTLLHELLSLDEQLSFPSTFDAFIPHHFLISSPLIKPILRLLLPGKRPMDDMSVGVNTPQEDDFALMLLGAPAHYRHMGFPQSEQDYEQYLDFANLGEAASADLRTRMTYFMKAVTYKYKQRLVLKSPPHTGRIQALAKWFPGAKFVHISRQPTKVVPSTMRLWKLVHDVHGFQLPKYSERELFDYVNDCQRIMYQAYNRDVSSLADDQIAEVSFEQLIAQPAATIRSIYQTLNLTNVDQVVTSAEDYLGKKKGHKKNQYDFSSYTPDIESHWSDYMQQFGYTKTTGDSSP